MPTMFSTVSSPARPLRIFSGQFGAEDSAGRVSGVSRRFSEKCTADHRSENYKPFGMWITRWLFLRFRTPKKIIKLFANSS
jgi:hypothetical protein